MTTKKCLAPFFVAAARIRLGVDQTKWAFAPFGQRTKAFGVAHSERLTSSLTRSDSRNGFLSAKGDLQPRQDSNLIKPGKRLFYPLNYGAVVAKIERPMFCGGKDATHL